MRLLSIIAFCALVLALLFACFVGQPGPLGDGARDLDRAWRHAVGAPARPCDVPYAYDCTFAEVAALGQEVAAQEYLRAQLKAARP